MDKKFMLILKEFYVLENFQVQYYESQVNSSTDEYYGKAFQKMIEMEQAHAEYFEALIEKAGEAVPTTVGSMFKAAALVIGESVEVNGQQDACTLGVKLESKAVKAYKAFINECSEKKYMEIKDTLMGFLLEEEFHTLWLENYAKRVSNTNKNKESKRL